MNAFGIAIVAGTLVAGSALGQVGSGGTISNGDTVFTIADYATSGTGNGQTANFSVTGAAGTDHMFQTNWWYRLPGQTRESVLNSATSFSYVGNIAQVRFTLGNGVIATLTSQVQQTGAGSGRLTQTLDVTNNTLDPITISLFNYADLDVNNTGTNDVTILSNSLMRAASGGITAQYSGIGAGAYQEDAFSGLRTLLADTAITNLTSLPVVGTSVQHDFTGGYQWNVTIDPGFSRSVVSTVSITVPTPGAAALMGLGGLAAFRRRR